MSDLHGFLRRRFLCCYATLLRSGQDTLTEADVKQKRLTGQVLLCLLFTKVNCCLRFKSVEPREEIGHIRVPPGLCFKASVGAQPFIWKSFFILMQIKLIFTRKIVHLASFSK